MEHRKRRFTHRSLSATVAAGLAAVTAGCGMETKPMALAASDTAACTAPASWFPDTPIPNTFPAQPNNCDFHKWSWQMFLWLHDKSSSAADAPLNFETLANPGAVLKPGGPTAPYPGRVAGEPMDMLARLAKSSQSVDADDIFQAGAGNKILIDQAGNVVYYSGLLNETFWDFVTSNSLYALESLQRISPTADFPDNTLELKVSWRVAALLDTQGNPTKTFIPDADQHYYTAQSTVPVVEVVDGKVTDNTGKTQSVELALVGMHVVGVVQNHPEFIWATFEHKANAPDCSAVPTGSTDPATGLPWSLYTPESGIGVQNQFNVNDPLNIVSVCRQAPWGGGDATNTANIQSLNASVAPHLAGTVWENYELVGAVWTTGGNDIPGANGAPMAPGDQQIGSLKLANTTMETFTQDANCFACHNGGVHTVTIGNSGQIVPAKHLDLSHFIVNYQAWLQAAQGAK